MHLTRRRTLATALAAPIAGRLAAPAIVAAQSAILRIGAPLPLTGPLAPEGVKQRNGIELWMEAVNRQPGTRVEVVFADYASNTPRAVQTAERMISQDRCNALFAPFGSGAAKAGSSVAERYKVPMLAATASSKEVYDQGYKYLFGTFTPNETLTEPLGDVVRTGAPEVKRITILARNDLFPLAIAQEMEKSAKARGLEVVGFERYAIGALDHASALTKLGGGRPDWWFITGYLNDLILARRQMAELGLTAPVVSMIAGPAYKEFVAALGPNAEGLTSAAWWHPAVDYRGPGPFPTTAAFNEAYRTKFNAEPDYGEASAACCGTVLQLAAQAAGSLDGEKLRDAVAALDITTFFGRVKFGPTGQITSLEPPVFQVQAGQPVVLHPQGIKQGEFRRVG